jgi:hypothetical protein
MKQYLRPLYLSLRVAIEPSPTKRAFTSTHGRTLSCALIFCVSFVDLIRLYKNHTRSLLYFMASAINSGEPKVAQFHEAQTLYDRPSYCLILLNENIRVLGLSLGGTVLDTYHARTPLPFLSIRKTPCATSLPFDAF